MKKNYSELLKDPRWQKKRLEIFKRDNFTCRVCGSTENTLHVHHKEYHYNKSPWSYKNDNYLTVCESCHSIITYYKKEYSVDLSEDKINYVPHDEPNYYSYIIGHGRGLIMGQIINGNLIKHLVRVGSTSFDIICRYIAELNSKSQKNE
jgi:hypothetical protein